MRSILEIYEELKNLSDSERKQRANEFIEEFIGSLPEHKQKVFRQKQWCIESELIKYKNPVMKMNKMIELFWEGVKEFKDVTKNM